MLRKAFIYLQEITVDNGVSNFLAVAVVLNSDGTLAPNPLGAEGPAGFAVPMSYGSTLATLRVAVQTQLAESYGFTPTYVWLDDKGLL